MNTNVTIGRNELELIKALSGQTEQVAETALKVGIFTVLMQECETKEVHDCAAECADTALAIYAKLNGG